MPPAARYQRTSWLPSTATMPVFEIAEQSFGEVQATLDKALDLSPTASAPTKAPGHLRRQRNEALFERIPIYDDRIDGAEVAGPFPPPGDPALPQRLGGCAPSRTAASHGGGSNEALIVGAPGFEPGTSPTRTVRATRLRHAPRRSSLVAHPV
jgi:hypothetical protein